MGDAATKRLMNEFKEINKNPTNHICIRPCGGENMKKVIIVFYYPPQSDFEKGVYFGIAELDHNYPMTSPTFRMMTPNGRFESGSNLCTTTTSFHNGDRVVGLGLHGFAIGMLSFMNEDYKVVRGQGGKDDPPAVRRRLAEQSMDYNLKNREFRETFPEAVADPNWFKTLPVDIIRPPSPKPEIEAARVKAQEEEKRRIEKEDEEFARRLQAQFDAEANRAQGNANAPPQEANIYAQARELLAVTVPPPRPTIPAPRPIPQLAVPVGENDLLHNIFQTGQKRKPVNIPDSSDISEEDDEDDEDEEEDDAEEEEEEEEKKEKNIKKPPPAKKPRVRGITKKTFPEMEEIFANAKTRQLIPYNPHDMEMEVDPVVSRISQKIDVRKANRFNFIEQYEREISNYYHRKKTEALDAMKNVFPNILPGHMPALLSESEPVQHIPLYPHQLIGVRWMMRVEEQNMKIALLGDEKGLGKTPQTVSLCVTRPAWPVLVVCPTGCIGQWIDEFKRANVRAVQLTKQLLEAGPQHLAPVMITSPNTIYATHRMRNAVTLAVCNLEIQFGRVILDEYDQQLAQLNVDRLPPCRIFWLLSGNELNMERVGQAFDRLRDASFVSTTRPNGVTSNIHGYMERAIMRRQKDLLDLPPVTVQNMEHELDAPERAYYTQALASMRTYFENKGGREMNGQWYTSIMSRFTTLRRVCTSCALANNLVVEEEGEDTIVGRTRIRVPPPQMSAPRLLKLREDVRGRLEQACPVCRMEYTDPTALSCAHVVCLNCLQGLADAGRHNCPVCNQQINEANVFMLRALGTPADFRMDMEWAPADLPGEKIVFANNPEYVSSRTREILRIIALEDSKIIVASWHDAYLQKLRKELPPSEILLGSQPATTRSNVMRRFQEGEAKILLLSIRATAVGLNLTAAHRIVVADPYFDRTRNQQLIARVNRIGQKAPLTVYNVYAKDTIEEKLVRHVNVTDRHLTMEELYHILY